MSPYFIIPACVTPACSQMASLSTPSISELEQIEALFDDDRWFDAVEKYEEHKKLIDETLASEKVASEKVASEKVASEKVSKIKQASGELKHLMQELKSTEGWELKSHPEDADDVWYRYEEDKQTHSFRTEGFVKAPLLNLISLIYEFDLFPNWCKCGVMLLLLDLAVDLSVFRHLTLINFFLLFDLPHQTNEKLVSSLFFFFPT